MGWTKYQYCQMPEKERRAVAFKCTNRNIQRYAAHDPAESVRIALLLNPSTKKNHQTLLSMLRKEPDRSIRIMAENLLLEERLGSHGNITKRSSAEKALLPQLKNP